MIQQYNRKSFVYGIPGFILQIAGNLTAKFNQGHSLETIGMITALVGTLLLLIGFMYYAKAKGRHPAWCLLAFLWLIGLLVLSMLKDKSAQAPAELLQESKSC